MNDATSREPLDATKAGADFADVLRRVVRGKERVIIRKGKRPVAALVPMDDLRLLEELEDEHDLRVVRERLAEWERGGRKSIPIERVARRLGVKL